MNDAEINWGGGPQNLFLHLDHLENGIQVICNIHPSLFYTQLFYVGSQRTGA